MMESLQSKIDQLTVEFAEGVLNALRGASLLELLAGDHRGGAAPPPERTVKAPKAKKSGRLARRGPEQIEATIATIRDCLKAHPAGMRSEELQKSTGLDKREIASPIAQALAAKTIKKTGEKRATTYFAAGAGTKTGSKVATPKKATKKVAPKKKTVKAKAAPKKTSSKKKSAKAASKKSVAKKSARKPVLKAAPKKSHKKKTTIVKAKAADAPPVAAVANGARVVAPS